MARFFSHRTWIWILLALSLCSCGRGTGLAPTSARPPQAQPAASRPTAPAPASPGSVLPLRFQQLSVDDGLSESVVQDILQDNRGLMWFATEDGLNQFDGRNFTIFKQSPTDPNSLSNSNVSELLEDHSGFLWIGTFNGLNRYDPDTGRFTRFYTDYGKPGTLSSNSIRALAEDKNGDIWIGTDEGLNRYDRASGTFESFLHAAGEENSLIANRVNDIIFDHKGILWIATSYGLDSYDPVKQQFTHYTHDPGNPDSLISSNAGVVIEDKARRLWVGTEAGLDRFDREVNRFVHFSSDFQKASGLSDSRILDLASDSQGRVWAGTMNGLCQYLENNNQFRCTQSQNNDNQSLSASLILKIYEDRSGTLWVGTWGGGINRMNPSYKVFEHYYNSPSSRYPLSDVQTFAILRDPDGTLWVGYDDHGLDRIDGKTGRLVNYTPQAGNPDSIASNRIRSVKRDRQGNLWIATANGLDRLDEKSGRFIHYRHDPENYSSISGDAATSLAVDAQGSLWIGTSSGLNRLDGMEGRFTNFTHSLRDESSISGNFINTLYIDSAGDLWVGTAQRGLNQYDRTTHKFIHYINDPGDPGSISEGQVLSVYEDRGGTLWVGTTGGLNRLDRKSGNFTHYNTENGLPNDYIYAIQGDAQGFLWMSTNNGLARLDPRSGMVKSFDLQDGLQSNEFNAGAAFQEEGGRMYFGGINGLTVFDPATIRENPYVPPVVLTSLNQRGDPIPTGLLPQATREITLRWPQNYFDFEFAALDYTRPEQNQYAYTLEGFDRDWNYNGSKNTGTYTNLPGGSYTLRLKGSNNDGLWNDAGASIRVTVIPPFWETLWFRGGLVILILGSVFAGIQFSLRGVEKRNRDLERLVCERTAEIEHRSREMEALYKAGERMHRLAELDKVLLILVDAAVDMLQAEKSAVFLLDRGSGLFKVKIARGFSPQACEGLSFSANNGQPGTASHHSEPVMVMDTALPESWGGACCDTAQAFQDEGIASFLHLPLTVGKEMIGIFHISYTHPNAFDDDAVRLFGALAQRAGLSIENAQLLEQAKELVVVEERSRLARDLHDSAKQKAFAALAQLGAAQSLSKLDLTKAVSHLDEAETLVYEVIQDLTFLIQEMYPMALKEKGLALLLRDYAFEWENRTGITVDLTIEGERRLPLEIEQSFYRLAQESLANIARHSRAARVEIHLSYLPDALEICIQDDGCGFDPQARPAGVGLRSMQERVSRLCGSFHIQSQPGSGTLVSARVPVKCS